MKLIKILLLFIMALTCLYGQKKQKPKIFKERNLSGEKTFKINPTKPTVYIDFVKIGDGDPVRDNEPRERIYLKLVNNSKWSIYIPKFTYKGISDNTTGLYYDVEIENKSNFIGEEIPQGYRRGDCCKVETELKSGETVNFSVPANHLAVNLMIRVNFYYEWVWISFETVDTIDSPYPEIVSSVYFTHSMLEKLKKR